MIQQNIQRRTTIVAIIKVAPDIKTRILQLKLLRAYWKFNVASGNIPNKAGDVGSPDSLGSDADLAVTGATHGSSGLIDDALSNDGIDDFENDVSGATILWNFFHKASEKWTINMWIKLNVANPDGFEIIMDNSGNLASATGIQIAMEDRDGVGQRALRCTISRDTTGIVNLQGADDFFPNNITEFTMVTITWDETLESNNLKFFKNGVFREQATKINPGGGGNATKVLHLAKRLTDDFFGPFVFDETSIWSKVLSDAEIIVLNNNGKGFEL